MLDLEDKRREKREKECFASGEEYKSQEEVQFRRTSLTGFPSQSIRSSNAIALDSRYLLVLITGTSQSRQHESRKSPTKSLFDVGSRRISIVTVNTKEYHSDVLAIITRIIRREADSKIPYSLKVLMGLDKVLVHCHTTEFFRLILGALDAVNFHHMAINSSSWNPPKLSSRFLPRDPHRESWTGQHLSNCVPDVMLAAMVFSEVQFSLLSLSLPFKHSQQTMNSNSFEFFWIPASTLLDLKSLNLLLKIS
ncbi:hypothetical protein Tco_1378718 [Tanacetum coccineum]